MTVDPKKILSNIGIKEKQKMRSVQGMSRPGEPIFETYKRLFLNEKDLGTMNEYLESAIRDHELDYLSLLELKDIRAILAQRIKKIHSKKVTLNKSYKK